MRLPPVYVNSYNFGVTQGGGTVELQFANCNAGEPINAETMVARLAVDTALARQMALAILHNTAPEMIAHLLEATKTAMEPVEDAVARALQDVKTDKPN
ncbi:MAG: hypothetical protein JO234_04245 [Hyphomicrobiales bacterium]|nr:hypothetical protein [Hyphomicrobiales bacterium]